MEDWANKYNYELQFTSPGESHTSHMFYLIAESPVKRDMTIEKLKEAGVQALFHYQALADSQMGARYAAFGRAYTNSQKLTRQLFRLPLYFSLSGNDQERVVAALTK